MAQFKKLVMFLLIGIALLNAAIAISPQERIELRKAVDGIVNLTNAQDFEGLKALISPNARQGLFEEIEQELAAKEMSFKIQPALYKETNGKFKVSATYFAQAPGLTVEINTPSAFFVFERVNGKLLLVDTNFHKLHELGTALKSTFASFAEFLGLKFKGGKSSIVAALVAYALIMAAVIFLFGLLLRERKHGV